jgi:cellobiose transport system substrate-binding protein
MIAAVLIPPGNVDHPTPDVALITLTLATFNKFGYSDAMLAQFPQLHPNTTVVRTSPRHPRRRRTTCSRSSPPAPVGDVGVEVDWMPKLGDSEPVRRPVDIQPRVAGLTGECVGNS